MNTPKSDEIQRKEINQINIDFSQKYKLPKAIWEKIKILSFFLRWCQKWDKYIITDSKWTSLKIEMIDCICSINTLPIIKIEWENDPFMMDISGSSLIISNTSKEYILDIVCIEKL